MPASSSAESASLDGAGSELLDRYQVWRERTERWGANSSGHCALLSSRRRRLAAFRRSSQEGTSTRCVTFGCTLYDTRLE